MPESLPNGTAHLEIQLSPTLVEFAVNKHLTANHLEIEDGEPLTHLSYCVDNVEFLEPTGSERNVLLLRMSLGLYTHVEHLYLTLPTVAPVLCLRITIEDQLRLSVSQEDLEFPQGWTPDQCARTQTMVDELLSSVADSPDLPTSFHGINWVTVKEYMLKCTSHGHALLGVAIESDLTYVNTEHFHSQNAGLTAEPDRHWGLSVHQEVIKRLLMSILPGRQDRDLVLHLLEFGDIAFGNYRLNVDGSGTFWYWDWVGPGLTHESCAIDFDYTATVRCEEQPQGRYILLHVDTEGNFSWETLSDILDCIKKFETPADVIRDWIMNKLFEILGYGTILKPVYWILSRLGKFMEILAAGRVDANTPVAAAGIEDLGNGDFRVSLADALPDVGGLLWPLRPLELDWGTSDDARRARSISATGDLGDWPTDIARDRLHPAYQFVGEPTVPRWCDFVARHPITGPHVGYTQVKTVEVRNPVDDGLVAITAWEIEEDDSGLFSRAFAVLSSSPTKETIVVTPGGHLPIRVQFGPYVYDEQLGFWRPNNGFAAGTQFHAKLRIEYLQVNAYVGEYVLEQKEIRVPLVGTVKKALQPWEGIPSVHAWQLRDRLIMQQVAEVIASFQVGDYFDYIPILTRGWTVLELFSDDPGLAEMSLLDSQGQVLSSGTKGRSLVTTIDARLEHGLRTTATAGIGLNHLSIAVEQYMHATRIAYRRPVTDLVLSRNVLGVATGRTLALYDVGDPGAPRRIGQYQAHTDIVALSRTREAGRPAFVVAAGDRVVALSAPKLGEENAQVLREMVLPLTTPVLDVRILGQDRVAARIENAVQTFELTPGGVREIGERDISNARQVAMGSRWAVTVDAAAISVVCLSDPANVLSRHRYRRAVEYIEVCRDLLYLYGRGGGAVVFSLRDPTKPAEVARYYKEYSGKNLLVSGRGAFRLSGDRLSINCYRRHHVSPRDL